MAQRQTHTRSYRASHAKFTPKPLIRGGREVAKYIDAEPTGAVSAKPVVYFPGWCVFPEAMRGIAASLVGHGRRAVMICASHGIDGHDRCDFSEPEERKVEAFEQLIKCCRMSRTKINAIAHSEGALHVTAAAMEHPARFGTIVLINPAGVIESDSPLAITVRCVADWCAETARKLRGYLSGKGRPDDAAVIRNSLSFILRQQLEINAAPLRSLQEIQTLGRQRIFSRLKALRKKGVRIVVILSTDDIAIPVCRCRLKARRHCDVKLLMPGMHNDFLNDPDPYIAAALKVMQPEKSR